MRLHFSQKASNLGINRVCSLWEFYQSSISSLTYCAVKMQSIAVKSAVNSAPHIPSVFDNVGDIKRIVSICFIIYCVLLSPHRDYTIPRTTNRFSPNVQKKERRDHLEKSSVSRRFLASLAGFEPTAFRLWAQEDSLEKARVLGEIPISWPFHAPYVTSLAHVNTYLCASSIRLDRVSMDPPWFFVSNQPSTSICWEKVCQGEFYKTAHIAVMA